MDSFLNTPDAAAVIPENYVVWRGASEVKTNITKKEKVMRILSEEEQNIKAMIPEEGENEVSYGIRKMHYLAELKAVRTKIYHELK